MNPVDANNNVPGAGIAAPVMEAPKQPVSDPNLQGLEDVVKAAQEAAASQTQPLPQPLQPPAEQFMNQFGGSSLEPNQPTAAASLNTESNLNPSAPTEPPTEPATTPASVDQVANDTAAAVADLAPSKEQNPLSPEVQKFIDTITGAVKELKSTGSQ